MEISHLPALPKRAKKEKGLAPLVTERLPIGEIAPRGWLREQLDRMCSGMTGHLYEYGPFFKKENNAFLYPESGGGWEEVPYWLRGFYPLGVLCGDERILHEAQKYIDNFFSTADSDGWFGPKHLKNRMCDEINIPDVYPYYMLLDVMILYYEHTKDEKAIELVYRFLAFCRDHAETVLRGDAGIQITRAGDMLHIIYYVWDLRKEDWLLELAEKFHAVIRGDRHYLISIHAVDMAQRYGYDGIFSRQSGDEEDLEKTEGYYEALKRGWGGFPGGIFAADELLREGCTDPRQGYEVCGMAEFAKNFYELGGISGDGTYGDRAEEIMLNHFVASFTADYRQMHYMSSCNLPILDNYFYHPTNNGTVFADRSFLIFTPNNRCCGHNTGMGWPWYSMNLWRRTVDGGLVSWLYSSCEVDTVLDGQRVALREETNYPFDGKIKITVTKGQNIPLYFRIPAWAENVSVRFPAGEVQTGQNNGYLRVLGASEGDTVEIEFGMAIRTEDVGPTGAKAVFRGPLAFSLRIPEIYKKVEEDAGVYNQPDGYLFDNLEVFPGSDWNYGLDERHLDDIRVKEIKTGLAAQPFTEQDAPVVLEAFVRQIPEWGPDDHMAGELQPSPAYSSAEMRKAELIPLGCARLRISVFPTVTDREDAVHWEKTKEHTPIEERPGCAKNVYQA